MSTLDAGASACAGEWSIYAHSHTVFACYYCKYK
jgi:hypothetical protein